MSQFISPDPIGFAGDRANLYTYGDSDPVNCVDSSGLTQSGDIEEYIRQASYVRRHGLAGGVNPQVMERVNQNHEDLGYGRFRSGNRPLVRDVLMIYTMAEGGGLTGGLRGPGGCGGGCLRGCGGHNPGPWKRFTDWLRRRFGRRPLVSTPQRYQTVFQTSSGPFKFDADLSIEGSDLILSEVEIFPTEALRLELGTQQMLGLLRPLFRQLARERGATHVVVEFKRVQHGRRSSRPSRLRWKVR